MACISPTPTPTPAAAAEGEEETELRRGPWTVEEDIMLVNYIENHGEGRWDSVAACSGAKNALLAGRNQLQLHIVCVYCLKRTGKSCRLRWMNYLRPDVRRGNITPEEQLLILELHSRFGNRWSKIAKHLPGRTDNEIKNYWRTKVLKHAKQLRCDVSSQKFKDVMQYLWMPRLLEKIRAASGSSSSPPPAAPSGQPGQSAETTSSSSDVVSVRVPSPPMSDSTAANFSVTEGGQINSGDQIPGAEFGSAQSPGDYCNPELLEFEQWEVGYNLWNFDDIWS